MVELASGGKVDCFAWRLCEKAHGTSLIDYIPLMVLNDLKIIILLGME
jgi:hypothetical protein